MSWTMLAESVPSVVFTVQPVWVSKADTQLSLGSVALLSAYPSEITRSPSPSPAPSEAWAVGWAEADGLPAELQEATSMPTATIKAGTRSLVIRSPLHLHLPTIPGFPPGTIRAAAPISVEPADPGLQVLPWRTSRGSAVAPP